MFQNICFRTWDCLYLFLLRPMLKWVFRKVTGKCELLRITYNEKQGAERTKKIESSLRYSKTAQIKKLSYDEVINEDDAIKQVQKLKDIKPEVHPGFAAHFKTCLCQICGYKKLITEVEAKRKEKYSSDNSEHEALLMQVWTNLMPETPLESRICKQWGDIGFQGEDPMTDFRGMGILGLQNLEFLSTTHTNTARHLLSRSHHPKFGYSFAIVGINITSMTYELLLKGYLKTHFYNLVQGYPKLEHFHNVYCYLFYAFDKYWFEEEPKDIMEFNRVRSAFQKHIMTELQDNSTMFVTTFNDGDS